MPHHLLIEIFPHDLVVGGKPKVRIRQLQYASQRMKCDDGENKSLITSLIFIAFSIVVIVFSRQLKPLMRNDVGSGFFPTVVGVAMLALSVFRLVLAIREKPTENKASKDDLAGGLETILLIGAYCLVFNSLGFIVSTILYLFFQTLVLTPKEKRNWLVIALISLIAPFVIYALFVYAINTPLPKGIFGF